MTNQQILEKAIQKAIDGGWGHKVKSFEYKEAMGIVVFHYKNTNIVSGLAPEQIIFNHDFAKALWGIEMISTFPWAEDGSFKYETRAEAWMHHLQQMVIADNPIGYLGQHLGHEGDE